MTKEQLLWAVIDFPFLEQINNFPTWEEKISFLMENCDAFKKCALDVSADDIVNLLKKAETLEDTNKNLEQNIYNSINIGKQIGKHRTTISRDIKSGLVKNLTSELIEIYVYSAEVAQRKNEENETAKGTYQKIGTDMKLASFIEMQIKEGKTIHDRPEEIKTREEIGHWEMDLVEGLKGQKEPYLLVLSERRTRKEIIELIPNKSAKSVSKALDRIEREIGVVKFRETFKTITTDNGAEFRNWKSIEYF